MNPLTGVRAGLKLILDTETTLFAFVIVPAKAAPPLAYIAPGEPYLTYEGAAFGGEIVRCNVGVVASAGDNESQADELDDMIVAVLDVLRKHDDVYQINDVGQPGRVTLNGQSYLAVSIEVQTEIRR